MNRIRLTLIFLLFVPYVLMLSSWPNVFTYKVGLYLCAAFLALAVLSNLLQRYASTERPLFKGLVHRVEASFPLLLLLAVTSYAFGILNERLYSFKPEAHSVYGGFFTIGGLVPMSDNKEYMSAAIQFLRYGEMSGQASYRPLAHLFNAFLLRLSGGDWIRFFQFTTLLLVFSIWYHGLVMARYLGRFVACVTVFILCRYFASFQATFLTELPGGMLGMVSIALLVHGFLTRSLSAYMTALCLAVLAMHMRVGVVFILPAMALLGAIRFCGWSRRGVYVFLTLAVFQLSVFLLPSLQYRLFGGRVVYVSNYGEYAYKVYENSDRWPVKKLFSIRKEVVKWDGFDDHMSQVNSATLPMIRNDPWTFLKNYVSMAFRYSARPERYIVPWSGRISFMMASMLFLLFLSGFWLYAKGSFERYAWWILLAYVACSLMSLPFVDFTKDRSYAVTISLNTLLFAFAVQNVILLGIKAWDSSVGRRVPSLRGDALREEPDAPSSREFGSPWLMVFPALLIASVLIGPLVVDRLRVVEIPVNRYSPKWGHVPGTELMVVPMKGTPRVTLEAGVSALVKDPLVMPRNKWYSDAPPQDRPQARTHWILAGNLLDHGRKKMNSRHLLLPDSMMNGVDLMLVDTLVVRMDTATFGKMPFRYSKVSELVHFTLKTPE